jgi:hypothetical protein
LADPWNKLFAILTPGVGYLAGHGLDLMLEHLAAGEPQRQRSRVLNQQIRQMRSSISRIEKESTRVKKTGVSGEVLERYEGILRDARLKLAEVLQETVDTR